MKYRVRRYWEVTDVVEVEAETVAEAIDLAHELPLTEGDYVDDSINTDDQVDVFRA